MRKLLIDVHKFSYLHEVAKGETEMRIAYRYVARPDWGGRVVGDRSPTQRGALENVLQKLGARVKAGSLPVSSGSEISHSPR